MFSELCDECGVRLTDPTIDVCEGCSPTPVPIVIEDEYLLYLTNYQSRADTEYYALGG